MAPVYATDAMAAESVRAVVMQQGNEDPTAPVVVPDVAGGTYRDFLRMNSS